jgi:hypothetical protein
MHSFLIDLTHWHFCFFFPGEQVKQIRNDAFVHPQSIYKTIDALWDGEI